MKAKREQEILHAAMKVFSRDGFSATDVEKIAALAKVGKGTVYRHFGNKQDLFLAVVEWGLNTLNERILEATKDIEDPIERISAAIYTYMEFFEQNRRFYRVLVQDQSGGFRERVEREFKEKYFAHLHLLEEVLEKGMQLGIFKRMDVSSAALALVGSSNALIYKWLIADEEYPLKGEVRVIMDTFFWGIVQSASRGG